MMIMREPQLVTFFNDVRKYSPLTREEEIEIGSKLSHERDRMLRILSGFPPYFEHLEGLRISLTHHKINPQEVFYLGGSGGQEQTDRISLLSEIIKSLGTLCSSPSASASLNCNKTTSRGGNGSGKGSENGNGSSRRPSQENTVNLLMISLSFTQDYLNRYIDDLEEGDVRLWMGRNSGGNDETKLLQAYRNLKDSRSRYQKAATSLVLSNLRLVIKIAKRYSTSGIPLTDILQEGAIGLMKAVDRFDVTRGTRFSTYAMWWIRQAINRSVLHRDRIIRLPVHLSERIRRLQRSIENISQQEGEELSLQEIRDRFEIKDDHIFHWMNMLQCPKPLESTSDEGGEQVHLLQILADENYLDPLKDLTRDRLRMEVDCLLGSLTYREQRVIQLRFGISSDRKYTLEEVGQQLGVTRERIRQIENRALKKLRHPSRSLRLSDFR